MAPLYGSRQSGPAAGSSTAPSTWAESGTSVCSAGIGSGTPAVILVPSARVPPVCGLVAQGRRCAGPAVERDPQRRSRVTTYAGAADATCTRARRPRMLRERVLRQLDQHRGAPPGDPEAEGRPARRAAAGRSEPAAVVAHAGEAEDQGAPHAAGRGDVQPVDGVAVQVGRSTYSAWRK